MSSFRVKRHSVKLFTTVLLIVLLYTVYVNQTNKKESIEFAEENPAPEDKEKINADLTDNDSPEEKDPLSLFDRTFELNVKRSQYKLKDGEASINQELDFETLKVGLEEYRKSIASACKNFLDPEELSKPIFSWEFLINHQFKLVYCPIFKAASSTWLYNFILLADISYNEAHSYRSSVIQDARQYYPRPKVEDLQNALFKENYTSLLIVRDPFERLLSSFRDKIEKISHNFFKPLRCEISKHSSSKNHGCQPTFSEFVNFIIDQDNENKILNEHWRPYYKFCSPCQVNFDYVLNFETLQEEEHFFLSQIPGLSAILKPHHLHPSHTNYDEILSSYFSQLTSGQLFSLLKIYEKDFEIFGYDYRKYVDMLV